MSKESFVKSAAILSIAGFIVKILGAVYRIPLTNLIGTEGIGYYQPAYNIYNLLLVVSLSGFPTAIAKLVSERRALNNFEGAYQVYKISKWGLFVIGLVSSIFVLVFAHQIMDILGYPGSYYSMVALVPALFAVPLLSSYRGFFQGTQNMTPIAISQIIEQIFRVLAGLYFAYYLINYGLEEAAAGATFGASVGGVASLLVISIIFFINKKNINNEIKLSNNNKIENTWDIVKSLLYIAIPITIGASIAPLMGLVDSYLVSSRLSVIGYTDVQIADMFGELSGTAQTLINFPLVFSTAVAMSLVPSITDSFTKKHKTKLNKTSNAGVRIALIIGLPCGIGLYLLAEPIIALLFSSLGPEKHASAGELLEIMAISVIFLTLVQAFTAILQSVNKQFLPVKNLVVGLVVKVILSYILISIPSINIKGAAISTTGAYLVVALLNWYDINTKTPININLIKLLIKPILSSVVMAIAVFVSFKLLIGVFSQSISTLLSIAFAVIVYVIFLFVTGAITEEDLDLIPKGDKLKKFVRKK
ncbi:stage V sporulation protein B [Sedimentibacter acidaminivorans]|uniref:Stage V sporulation protein B n=1 Tax=Sedimentibacter acidaminivorans TaxID=913099 RepID=A0ABS4GF03_9FIRM|nr:polysaccharide biosynthesis protein [Sedimentibacter acidaminivorans]MBP1926229.1 stage V sporulation protein B [Sedimentibacter acidaminivorans]